MTREQIYKNTATRLMKEYLAALDAKDTARALQLDQEIDTALSAAIGQAHAQFTKPEFKEPQAAFQAAIDDGRLSDDEYAANYAGNYMYMGTYHGKDNFKNSQTRIYLP